MLYDDSPLKSSTRAWFMLTMFGAHDVAILDGGIAKWKAEGRSVAQGKETLRHRHFTVWQDDKNVRTKADMLRNLHEQGRAGRRRAPAPGGSPARTAETRPGVAGGHIPGALNLPHSQLFNADGTWKSPAELKALFEAAGIDLAKPVVDQLRQRHDRLGARLRAAPDRQERRRALRRQLERMGRRSRHSQGDRGAA